MFKKERIRTNKTYPPEFKTTVAEDLLTNKLSYTYTVNEYGLIYGKEQAQVVSELRHKYKLGKLLKIAKLSRSTYYYK